MIEDLKVNAVHPEADLAYMLTKLANDWPLSRIAELLAWANVTIAHAAAA